MSHQAVSGWEAGRASISAVRLGELATLYGVSTDYLIFGIGDIDLAVGVRQYFDVMPPALRDRCLMMWALFARRGVPGP